MFEFSSLCLRLLRRSCFLHSVLSFIPSCVFRCMCTSLSGLLLLRLLRSWIFGELISLRRVFSCIAFSMVAACTTAFVFVLPLEALGSIPLHFLLRLLVKCMYSCCRCSALPQLNSCAQTPEEAKSEFRLWGAEAKAFAPSLQLFCSWTPNGDAYVKRKRIFRA